MVKRMNIYVNSEVNKRNYTPTRSGLGGCNFEIVSDIDINCAGYTIINEKNTKTVRPNGRLDYQLIYISKGYGEFVLEDEKHIIEKNNLILYRPNEPQIYYFNSNSPCEIYYIHFGGTIAEKLLDEIGFKNKKILPYSNGNMFIGTVNTILNELGTKRTLYKTNNIASLYRLLVDISRSNENIPKYSSSTYDIIKTLRNEIEQTYFIDVSNDDYAQKCDMSTSYFLKCFKDVVGVTPKQYRDNMRIHSAKDLLVNSNYKINKIAQIVGFSDSMYFSRFFKKCTGLSPLDYRNKQKTD